MQLALGNRRIVIKLTKAKDLKKLSNSAILIFIAMCTGSAVNFIEITYSEPGNLTR